MRYHTAAQNNVLFVGTYQLRMVFITSRIAYPQKVSFRLLQKQLWYSQTSSELMHDQSIELDPFLSLTGSWSWTIGKAREDLADVISIHSFVIIIHSSQLQKKPHTSHALVVLKTSSPTQRTCNIYVSLLPNIYMSLSRFFPQTTSSGQEKWVQLNRLMHDILVQSKELYCSWIPQHLSLW